MNTNILQGIVTRGEGIAAKIGYPTANLDQSHYRKNPTPDGVYACWTQIDDEPKLHQSIAIIGVPPQRTTGHPKVEIHILDFGIDILGKHLKTKIVKKIRNIEAFSDNKKLIEQIKKDIELTKIILNSAFNICSPESSKK